MLSVGVLGNIPSALSLEPDLACIPANVAISLYVIASLVPHTRPSCLFVFFSINQTPDIFDRDIYTLNRSWSAYVYLIACCHTSVRLDLIDL